MVLAASVAADHMVGRQGEMSILEDEKESNLKDSP